MFPQQCFRNNVSSFAGAFMLSVWIDFGLEMRGLKMRVLQRMSMLKQQQRLSL